MKYKSRRILSLISLLLVVIGLLPAPRKGEKVYTGGTEECVETAFIPVSRDEETKISSRFFELFGIDKKETRDTLIVGGTLFGAYVKTDTVTVVESKSQRELKEGDKLIRIGNREITSIEDVEGMLRASNGEPILATVKRDGRILTVTLTPHRGGGEYRLGIRLKDTASGIGTITYIDPATGEFGGLGHGICDPDSGEVIGIEKGEVKSVMLDGVEKGESGKPGELSGILTDKTLGVVTSNTECGLFGCLDTVSHDAETMELEIAHRYEVKTGKAYVYSTVKNGKKTKFDIEITDVDTSSHGTKSFKIKVTDPALKALTGGIVRGMSGSPIIQNGKLVGAVTHVMVADPTEGYGIFIENMLNTAQSQVQPKAA